MILRSEMKSLLSICDIEEIAKAIKERKENIREFIEPERYYPERYYPSSCRILEAKILKYFGIDTKYCSVPVFSQQDAYAIFRLKEKVTPVKYDVFEYLDESLLNRFVVIEYSGLDMKYDRNDCNHLPSTFEQLSIKDGSCMHINTSIVDVSNIKNGSIIAVLRNNQVEFKALYRGGNKELLFPLNSVVQKDHRTFDASDYYIVGLVERVTHSRYI